MKWKGMEAAMAESMVSIVVALVLVVTGITIFSAHHRREHHGQRLWDRMRHRH
jgi:fumarate reductase subunit D